MESNMDQNGLQVAAMMLQRYLLLLCYDQIAPPE